MTLKDIAGMAGVSVATVSHVLNHRDNKVSPEVAARVRSIIKEVNYQPNTVAKALRSSKSSIIGVMTEDLSVSANREYCAGCYTLCTAKWIQCDFI